MNVSGALAAIGGYARGKREWMQDVEEKRRWESDLQMRQQTLDLEKERVKFEGQRVDLAKDTLAQQKVEFQDISSRGWEELSLRGKELQSLEEYRKITTDLEARGQKLTAATVAQAADRLGFEKDEAIRSFNKDILWKEYEMDMAEINMMGGSEELIAQVTSNYLVGVGIEKARSKSALALSSQNADQAAEANAEERAWSLLGNLLVSLDTNPEITEQNKDIWLATLNQAVAQQASGNFQGAIDTLQNFKERRGKNVESGMSDTLDNLADALGIVQAAGLTLRGTQENTPETWRHMANETFLQESYRELEATDPDKAAQYFAVREGYGGENAPQADKARAMAGFFKPDHWRRSRFNKIISPPALPAMPNLLTPGGTATPPPGIPSATGRPTGEWVGPQVAGQPAAYGPAPFLGEPSGAPSAFGEGPTLEEMLAPIYQSRASQTSRLGAAKKKWLPRMGALPPPSTAGYTPEPWLQDVLTGEPPAYQYTPWESTR